MYLSFPSNQPSWQHLRTMIVTLHAVTYLISGVDAYNNNINAIDDEGVQFGAGQICTKDH
jgi:hypothetical protein